MAQVLKQAVRERIEAAALRRFSEQGYAGTSMMQIAGDAGTGVANLYRYSTSKGELFQTLVPAELVERHDRLLDVRIEALAHGERAGSPAAQELLDFWIEHRLPVVILLDRAEGTPYADYPAAFVERLVSSVVATLDRPLGPAQHEVLELVFDNTRRALARILRNATDRDSARALIEAFWSYQLPGLDGLMAHLRGVH
jgi:AcrR family transcriptional regulator